MHTGCIRDFMQHVLSRRSSQQEFKVGLGGSGSSSLTQKVYSGNLCTVTGGQHVLSVFLIVQTERRFVCGTGGDWF